MFRALAAIPIALLCTVLPAAAQDDVKDFPNRAIHIVVPFPAGGPADVVTRIIAQKMSEDWGQAVVVDNRGGGNTVTGALTVAKAPADGYTLLMAIDSTLVMNQFLYRSLPYDPINDFVPITATTKTVSVLAVSGANGPKTVAELIAKAKAAPGKLNYGAGTITAQLMGHLFHKAAGIDIVYVPFRGTPATITGLLTGSADLVYAANVTVAPLIESGQVRALAKLDGRTPQSMVHLPTLAEAAGVPLDDISVWLGLVAPKGTPRPIVLKLQQKVVAILNDPAVKERLERTGAYTMTSSPDEFGAFIRKEADRWSKVLPETGIRYD